MDLPSPLRQAIDRALSGVALAELAETAAALSRRYRDEGRTGKPHVGSDRDVLAYLATRLPATYAAVRASLAAIAAARPEFTPGTMLDFGAGPGTALWAAADCWPGISDSLLVEASSVFRDWGERLAADASLPRMNWLTADAAAEVWNCAPRDLVTMTYMLNELDPEQRPRVLQRAWQATAGILLIVEPGTPAGWQRILAARRQMIDNGARVIAPCPHAQACPLQPPDWCHFAVRAARSRLHRQAKGAKVPWEDEKFSYVAVSRHPASRAGARVIAPPRKATGRATLKLCRPDGSAAQQLFSRRDGAVYKRAARCNWGDSF